MKEKKFRKEVKATKRPTVKIPKKRLEVHGLGNLLTFMTRFRRPSENIDFKINSSQTMFLLWAFEYKWFDDVEVLGEGMVTCKQLMYQKFTGPLIKAGLLMKGRYSVTLNDLPSAIISQDHRVNKRALRIGRPKYRYAITERGRKLVREIYRYLDEGKNLDFLWTIPLEDVFSDKKATIAKRKKIREERDNPRRY